MEQTGQTNEIRAKTRHGHTTLQLGCLTEEQRRTVAHLVSETNPEFAHVIVCVSERNNHFTIGHRCADEHGPSRSHCSFLWVDKDGHVHYEQIWANGKSKRSVSSRQQKG